LDEDVVGEIVFKCEIEMKRDRFVLSRQLYKLFLFSFQIETWQTADRKRRKSYVHDGLLESKSKYSYVQHFRMKIQSSSTLQQRNGKELVINQHWKSISNV
jgi:hypothetical protein